MAAGNTAAWRIHSPFGLSVISRQSLEPLPHERALANLPGLHLQHGLRHPRGAGLGERKKL
jgi:hypothetical protein